MGLSHQLLFGRTINFINIKFDSLIMRHILHSELMVPFLTSFSPKLDH